jgi:hypothetical protein
MNPKPFNLLSMLEGSLNFARAFFNLQKAIKLKKIKERKI